MYPVRVLPAVAIEEVWCLRILRWCFLLEEMAPQVDAYAALIESALTQTRDIAMVRMNFT